METAKIYAASAGAKRGGRRPRSEAALPKFTMNLQECWRGETEGLARNGKRREGGRWSRARKWGDRAVGDRDMPLLGQNDETGMRGTANGSLKPAEARAGAGMGGSREGCGHVSVPPGPSSAPPCSTAQLWGVQGCCGCPVPAGSADPDPAPPPRWGFVPASFVHSIPRQRKRPQPAWLKVTRRSGKKQPGNLGASRWLRTSGEIQGFARTGGAWHIEASPPGTADPCVPRMWGHAGRHTRSAGCPWDF